MLLRSSADRRQRSLPSAPGDGGAPLPARRRSPWQRLALLGPAFVAAVAYVDPGNVAANLSAGAQYGFLLVWVLVLANAIAVVVQYQSAKLGIVTGKTLPQLLGERFPVWGRRLYWLQAEFVAICTDLAEVVGGAIALQILFGLPLPVGAVITGVVSMVILAVHGRYRQSIFERVIIFLLVVVTLGFLAGLVISPPAAGDVLGGMVPRFADTNSVLLAASMLGATVMPHAIYVHSALARDRWHPGADSAKSRTADVVRGTDAPQTSAHDAGRIRTLLRATRWDVVFALIIAGAVNIGMLLLAADALPGVQGTDTIEGAHAAISAALGPVVGLLFAIGLLASSFASTAVGSYAGATIMEGLLKVRISLVLRRLITLIPAVLILWAGMDATFALVLSQVVLSFGIPFAMIPLVLLTGSRRIMGVFTDRRILRSVGWICVTLVVALNVALIVLTFMGS